MYIWVYIQSAGMSNSMAVHSEHTVQRSPCLAEASVFLYPGSRTTQRVFVFKTKCSYNALGSHIQMGWVVRHTAKQHAR